MTTESRIIMHGDFADAARGDAASQWRAINSLGRYDWPVNMMLGPSLAPTPLSWLVKACTYRIPVVATVFDFNVFKLSARTTGVYSNVLMVDNLVSTSDGMFVYVIDDLAKCGHALMQPTSDIMAVVTARGETWTQIAMFESRARVS